MNTQEFA